MKTWLKKQTQQHWKKHLKPTHNLAETTQLPQIYKNCSQIAPNIT